MPQARADFDDEAFAAWMKQSLPGAPHDQWFVRKTMNRLPDARRSRRGTLLSWLCYLIAAVGVLAGCGFGLMTYLDDPASLTGLAVLLMTPLTALFCLGVIGAPMLSRISD